MILNQSDNEADSSENQDFDFGKYIRTEQLINNTMEIIAIEEKTFELIKQKFSDFAKQVKELCEDGQHNEKWIDK